MRSLARTLIPSTAPLVCGLLGMGVLALGSLLALLMSLDAGSVSEAVDSLGASSIFGFMPMALLFGLGGALEKRAAPRALLFGVGALAVVPGAALMIASMATDSSLGDAIGGGLCCFSLPGLALLIPAVVFAIKAPADVRRQLELQDERALVRALEDRGEVSLPELADQLGRPLPRIQDLAEGLIRRGELAGHLDLGRRRIFDRARFEERRQRLASAVRLRGRASVGDLAREFGVDREAIRELLYAAEQAGEFTGYIDWEAGVLYSRDAEKLRAGGQCPNCAGQLALAGKGLIRCSRCGTEIYL
jgi:hypothetical protein